MHQAGDGFNEHLLIDLIRDVVNDQNLAPGLRFFVVRMRADHNAPAPGAVALVHALETKDDAPRGKVWSGHLGNQFVNACVRVMQKMAARVHGFSEVVRRNVRCHTDRNTRRTVHQKVRKFRREHHRFFFGVIKVRNKVDGVFVEVVQHGVRNLRKTALRVTHGGRPVAVNGTEVTLTGNKRIAHRKVLREAHQRLVGSLVAMRVVLTDHVTHNTRALFGGIIEGVVELVHRVQNAAVHGLKAVTHIRKSTAHDHTHGVIEVSLLHFRFQRHGKRFKGIGNRHAVGFAVVDRSAFVVILIVVGVLIHTELCLCLTTLKMPEKILCRRKTIYFTVLTRVSPHPFPRP